MMSTRSFLGWSTGCARLLLVALGIFLTAQGSSAQLTYSKGKSISPAYEGWRANTDGSFTLLFGYMNSNWEEEFDVPIGPDNHIEPGGPDQGQPTHFLPRRNLFVFEVRVPKDFGEKELVWTLTTHGKTERAYATLKPDYLVDNQVIATEMGANRSNICEDFRWNTPPVLRVDGAKSRSLKVGQPLTLVAWASDDGIPADGPRCQGGGARPRPSRDQQGGADPRPSKGEGRHPAYTPPRHGNPSNGNGLRLSWFVYRGAAKVLFNPEQMKVWQDTRAYANSPWSPPFVIPPVPPEGKWLVQATFNEAGTYVLRCLAGDGALFAKEDLTVTVTP